jgi:hypothetical protein
MPLRKQIDKITYPNGKIYVGMDLTGSLLYMDSPGALQESARQEIADDLDAYRFSLTLRKEIPWESETATNADVRVTGPRQLVLDHPTGARTIWPMPISNTVQPINTADGSPKRSEGWLAR